MLTLENQSNAHAEIDYIFKKLFPRQGMPERPAQIELSHHMLDAMLSGKTALCEAGTGIGKTYAYLVAACVQHRYRTMEGMKYQPVLISTSSIALQKAITSEYLPLLSQLLLGDGIIQAPIQVVVRKGKRHYVCDERLDQRLRRANMQKKNKKNADALRGMQYRLGLDEEPFLSAYDAKKIAVPEVCDCDRAACRYRQFLKECQSGRYLFQICNHNLLMADVIHQQDGLRPILPDTHVLIVDEAHKLPETARQMFGAALAYEDFRELIDDLKQEQYLLASQNLAEASKLLLRLLSEPPAEELAALDYLKRLLQAQEMLERIQHQLNGLLTLQTGKKLDRLCRTVSKFSEEQSGLLYYVTENEKNGSLLCATANDLAEQMKQSMWSMDRSVILASGTLAVGGSFHHFEQETGLTGHDRLVESITRSPYRYVENCLLYLPHHPPRYQKADRETYFHVLTDQIAELLNASYGHGLVLFTSYAALSAVKELLSHKKLTFPVFAVGRKGCRALEQFRATPGSVLLATGAFWEGMDFPGDCVSMLIIPRLPFSFPDAREQRMKENYPSLKAYIQSVSVPQMQIKLRQGFGRAIRKETDTCVIAILDERATRGGRYHRAVMEALPELPVTGDIHRVERFIRKVKPKEYFELKCDDTRRKES